jgi:hypothetical protein
MTRETGIVDTCTSGSNMATCAFAVLVRSFIYATCLNLLQGVSGFENTGKGISLLELETWLFRST